MLLLVADSMAVWTYQRLILSGCAQVWTVPNDVRHHLGKALSVNALKEACFPGIWTAQTRKVPALARPCHALYILVGAVSLFTCTSAQSF